MALLNRVAILLFTTSLLVGCGSLPPALPQALPEASPKRSLREASRATPDDERKYEWVETGEVEQCDGGETPIPNVTR